MPSPKEKARAAPIAGPNDLSTEIAPRPSEVQARESKPTRHPTPSHSPGEGEPEPDAATAAMPDQMATPTKKAAHEAKVNTRSLARMCRNLLGSLVNAVAQTVDPISPPRTTTDSSSGNQVWEATCCAPTRYAAGLASSGTPSATSGATRAKTMRKKATTP